MKILIPANCQATALGQILGNVRVQEKRFFQILECPPSYMWESGFEAELEQKLKACDILFYQPHKAYSWTPHWRTSRFWLEQTSAVHRISFPSLFFSGYNPELTYIKGKNGRHLNEGFSDYHDIRIIRLFLSDVSAETANQQLDWFYFDQGFVSLYAEKSLKELEKKEGKENLEIRVSSYLRDHHKKRRLFFTFNHPANELLINVVEQLLKILGVQDYKLEMPGCELLNMDHFPMMPSVAEGLGLPLSDPEQDYVIQGRRLSRIEVIRRFFGVYWANRELVSSFYTAFSGADKLKIMDPDQVDRVQALSVKNRSAHRKNDEKSLIKTSAEKRSFLNFFKYGNRK